MVSVVKDGRTWRLGTEAEVAWITGGTTIDRTITSAIPPVFEAYATVVLPPGGEGQDVHDRAVLTLLSEQAASQAWWLGYLDTGADDFLAKPIQPAELLVTLRPPYDFWFLIALRIAASDE